MANDELYEIASSGLSSLIPYKEIFVADELPLFNGSYLFGLKLEHPDGIFLLAGNHEGYLVKKFLSCQFLGFSLSGRFQVPVTRTISAILGVRATISENPVRMMGYDQARKQISAPALLDSMQAYKHRHGLTGPVLLVVSQDLLFPLRTGPPARWMAPSTPPPPIRLELAALTIASVACLVMSPWIMDSLAWLIFTSVVFFSIALSST
jgi:hypothetical protein